MAMIDIRDMSFGYDGSDKILFDNVNLRIDTEWKLGLVGRNGRGKTTFLKILRGQLHYSGRISGSPEFISFPFDVIDEYDLVRDVISSIAPDVPEWMIRREINLLEMSQDILYKPYTVLSGGEKTKIQLIALFLADGFFPLIDEPTNHLDVHGREVVARYLSSKRGFILVSHDRSFLDLSTDHTMSINKSNIEISPVNFSTWWEQKIIKEKYEQTQNVRLKKDIDRLRKAEESVERWSHKAENRKIGFDPTKVEKSLARRPNEAAKAAKQMRRAKAIERRYDDRIEEKSSLLKNVENREALKISGQKHYSDLLIKASNLVLYYDGKPICKPINLEIHNGDKFSLQGTNGCGKSTLLELITGIDNPDLTYEGDLYKVSNLCISHVKQDTSFLVGTLRDYAFENSIDEPRFKSILSKMGFGKDNLEQDMASLSEGQKKCVLLAGSLCSSANIYVWDEPLNYIDIYMRQTIEEMLEEADITMLYVEHDKTFADKIATSGYELKAM